MEVTGRLSFHQRGFGFLTVESNDEGKKTVQTEETYFVPPPELNKFLEGDLVSALVTQGNNQRWSANNLSLIERARQYVLGEVVQRKGTTYLRIDREIANSDWLIDANQLQLHVGDWVIATVADDKLVAHKVLDKDEDVSLQRVIVRHSIVPAFSQAVLTNAELLGKQPVTIEQRRDLRAIPTVTIDGPSTRDIDDAISVLPAQSDGAVRLLVSIADVTHFVPEGSSVDLAARERGTSVYFPDRVLPMLPEVLSNAALSLLPGQERLCLTAELRIDAEGNTTAVDVYKSVIRSWARLNYTEVGAYLERSEISDSMTPVAAMLPWLRTVNARLGVFRARRGGVVMSRDDTKIAFDSRGIAAGVETVRSNAAHTFVERCMVAANEAVAKYLFDRGVPVPYRVHDKPDQEHTMLLGQAAHYFGFEPGFGKELTPLSLCAFDAQISSSPAEPALRSVMMRSLGSAKYTVNPSQHFGLAAPLYLHFTSPIRRYADVCVHRAIHKYLTGNREMQPDDLATERLAEHLNKRGRSAARAEVDRRRVLESRLMSQHIGEIFSARITRVRAFGLVVQIDSSSVEGMISVESLPDGPYQIDQRETELAGTHRKFCIGQAVRVHVTATDPSLGRIDFGWVSPPSDR